jgi:hypothetical protein
MSVNDSYKIWTYEFVGFRSDKFEVSFWDVALRHG